MYAHVAYSHMQHCVDQQLSSGDQWVVKTIEQNAMHVLDVLFTVMA